MDADANANANYHHRSMHMALYAIFVGVDGILVQTISQMTEVTQNNKTSLLISLATLVMNLVAALWVFSNIQHNHWKCVVSKTIFIVTGILSPYVAFSMLEPGWFTWHGFAVICIIVTIVEGHNALQFMFVWSYQGFVAAKKYLIERLAVLRLRCQSSTDNAV